MAWNLEEAISYYKTQGAPNEQNVLVSLLLEIQDQCDGIPQDAVSEIALAYGIKDAFVHAIIRRIPRLRLRDTHCLELCAGPNCSKHAQLAAFAEKLARSKGFTLKFGPCMRMCGKGPNIKWNGNIYHHADEALLLRLTQDK